MPPGPGQVNEHKLLMLLATRQRRWDGYSVSRHGAFVPNFCRHDPSWEETRTNRLLQLARVVSFGGSDTDDVEVVPDDELPVKAFAASLPDAVWSIARNEM